MNENENEVFDRIHRIKEKIMEIQEHLDFLVENTPSDFEEYENDLRTKAVCEHYFEKILEGCTDLAFLIIKLKNLRIPKEDGDAFIVLAEKGILLSELAKKLKEAKGMRNIIAHEYGKLDDSKVYHSLSEEIEEDVSEFLESIEGGLK
jgi:uncharacterized protein YutE (UPF0331/DUF86 family)